MPTNRSFPKAGNFRITSTPVFLLVKGNQSELLVMKAEMNVKTGKAYASSDTQQVDVEVGDWVATGKSKMLGGKVEFRLSKDKAQPKSYVKGASKRLKTGDFPAQLRFGMRYDVSTPQGTASGLSGVAKGAISAFPPKAGDVFNIQKTLELKGVRVVPVACLCATDAMNISLPA